MIADPKPYPAMKDSGVEWLGEVPEHWEVRQFRTLGSGFNNGTAVEQLASGESDYIVSRIETISNGVINYSKIGYLADDSTVQSYYLRENDFLISHINSYARVGNSARYNGERRLLHGMNLIRMTPLSCVSPVYAEYLMKSNIFIGSMQRACKPAINQVSVTTAAIKAIRLPLPPLPEQAAIVRYLDHVDRRVRRLVRAKRKLIALLTEQKQAIIHHAVTRGLDPDVPLKDSGVEWLGEVPEHWEVVRLGKLLRERGETNKAGEVTHVLSLLRDRGVIPYDEKGNIGNKKSDDITRYKVVHPNDIVMNCMNVIIGSVGLASEKGCLSPVYYVLTTRGQDHPRYLNAIFQCPRFHRSLVRIGNGILAHRMRIPMELLKCELFSVPPVDEQSAIVDFLDQATADIDTTISRAEREIELLNEYRTRLIADVVTGKLDVRGAAAALPDVDPLAEDDNADDLDAELDVDDLDETPEEVDA